MPSADMATRPTKVTLTFGLVSVPVALYPKTKDFGLDRKQYRTYLNDSGTFEDHPVGYASVDKVTGEIIDRSEVVKKVETEHGPVFVEDSEIEQIFELVPNTAKIIAFQPRSVWDTGLFVGKKAMSIEVQPATVGKKKVPNTSGEKTLQLILAVLEAENAVAVMELGTRGIPKPAVMLSDGTVWEVCWDEEVREPRPAATAHDLPEPLVTQMTTLVKSMWRDEPLLMSDERTNLIQAYANEKAQAGDFAKPIEIAAPEPVDNTDDLMAMLTASLEAAKAS